MVLLDRLTATDTQTTAPALPTLGRTTIPQEPQPAASHGEPARYDGTPPMSAWAWSWWWTGGSLTDMADALGAARSLGDELRGAPAPALNAQGSTDPQRALALLA